MGWMRLVSAARLFLLLVMLGPILGFPAARLAGSAISGSRATNDTIRAYYTFGYSGTWKYFRVFVDVDHRPDTGYGHGNAGADFLLENDALWRYTGDGNTWRWAKLYSTSSQPGKITYANDGAVAHWSIVRADIGAVGYPRRSVIVMETGTEDSDRIVDRLTQTFSPARPPVVGCAACWQPAVNTSWNIQFGGSIKFYAKQMYDIDPDAADVRASIRALHRQGTKVICYVDIGSWESYRPDAKQFPKRTLGTTYPGYPDERWLDIRYISDLQPIMQARMERCKRLGFDGIQFDNGGVWEARPPAVTGVSLSAQDQINYNATMANTAHQLGLSLGINGDEDQAADLVAYENYHVSESCAQDAFCNLDDVIVRHNKPVFEIEYTNAGGTAACATVNRHNFNGVVKTEALDEYVYFCRR